MKQLLFATIFLMSATWLFALDQLHPIPVVDQVDVIELNNFYDEKGSLVFTQFIFHEWCPEEATTHVRDWRLVKGPWEAHWHAESEEWRLTLWDGETLRSVRARGRGAFMESWTQFDPELTAREKRPHDQRRKLTCPPKPDRSVLRRSSPAAP